MKENLFEPHSRGSRFDHFMVQSGMIIRGAREGGLFIMIGRQQANSGSQREGVG
jgi:hypothetical protein